MVCTSEFIIGIDAWTMHMLDDIAGKQVCVFIFVTHSGLITEKVIAVDRAHHLNE